MKALSTTEKRLLADNAFSLISKAFNAFYPTPVSLAAVSARGGVLPSQYLLSAVYPLRDLGMVQLMNKRGLVRHFWCLISYEPYRYCAPIRLFALIMNSIIV